MVFACVAHLSARDLRMIAIGHSYFAGDDDINTIVPQMIGLRTDDNLTIEFKLCWAHMLWMHHLYDTLIAADAWPSTNQSDTAEKRVAYAAQ